MIFSFKLPAALLFFALGISASPAELSPLHLSKREVWSPPIISPDESTVWCIGAEETITWDNHPPQGITYFGGNVYLGHVNDGSLNENMGTHPLVHIDDLRQGSVTVKVPNVKPGNNYIVIIMGDSGNASNGFTIKQCF